MSRRSRTSLPGLLARQFRAGLGPFLAMAAIVLVVATLAATAPLALRSMTSAEVAYQLSDLPAARRDLISRAPGNPPIAAGETPFSQFDSALAKITGDAPKPLRDAMGSAVFVLSTGEQEARRLGVETNDPQSRISLNTSGNLAAHIRLTAGDMPKPFEHIHAQTRGTRNPPVNVFHRDPIDPQIDILLSTQSAEQAQWKVGEVRLVMIDNTGGFYANLSGTFDALNPTDGFWTVAQSALQPGISHTSFTGTNTKIVSSAAFINPGSWPVVIKETGFPVTTSVGIPLSSAGLTVEEDFELLPQLRHFTSQPQPVTNLASGTTVTSLIFASDAETALGTAINRASTATSVLVLVASGPIGVAIAALWLLSRLIVLRRRDSLVLASARGASGGQLRIAQMVEAFAVSLPAATIGAIAARALYPGSWTAISPLAAGLVALVPPTLIALATPTHSVRSTRSDVNPRSRGRYRWILEIVVLAFTALAVALLLQRGLTTNSETVGVDPLLAATPLLLAISAGLIVLRLYPLPLRGFARAAKRGRGIVAFLGANRSIRDPAAGLAPVLAMVVGIAIALFSGVLLGTVSGGVASAAHSNVGADLRIDSPILTQDQLDEIAAVDGVADSVALYQNNHLENLTVTAHDKSNANLSVPIIVVDTAALARVQRGLPDAAHPSMDMSKKGSELKIPVLLSPSLYTHYTITKDSTLAGTDIVNAGNPGTSRSLSGVEDWALIDVALAKSLNIDKFLPRITLLRLDPGADVQAVKTSLAAIVGPDASIQSPADAAAALNDSPISSGLQLSLLALIVITALLCAATVVLALMINGPSRERLLALLRTLGLTPRQARGITSWEIGPTALVAIVAGFALGVMLPIIVLAGVDFRPFTGGVSQPAIEVNPWLTGIIIGGFALLVLVASAIAMAAARRVNLARTLRTSEEG